MQTSTTLQQAVLPIIIVVGIIGNSLNAVVLTRHSLFYHACSRYFLALSGNNLFYSSVVCIISLLKNGYQIDVSRYSIAFCKAYTFINTLCCFLSPYIIVLASLDRCCASSSHAKIRNFTSIRMAHGMICIVIIAFALLFINVVFMTDINASTRYLCMSQAVTTYYQVYIITQVILFAVVPPCLMVSFGLITIRHTKRSRVSPMLVSRFHRTERQLARMLFFQVGTHIGLTLPTSVTFLIATLPNSVRTTLLFSFISSINQLLFGISFVTPFFTYILSSRVYRKQLLHILYSIRHCHSEPLSEGTVASMT
ncbi:unnamed protein product [Adineta ricciae]|uniref:G-protein coupled receptors family 1 profile domain-containing protein n=1 Tax=Adineta ricciae TaxID=249248 RepID=A0A814J746_ADIRI|nr:unnamed protein product [Adineta ricciae]CAF1032844.1 unnamed protein product [Adineta ricciae]